MGINEAASNPATAVVARLHTRNHAARSIVLYPEDTVHLAEAFCERFDMLTLPASVRYRQRVAKAIRLTDRFGEEFPQQEITSLPALHLRAFNFLTDHPQATDAEGVKELAHLRCMVAVETEFAKRVDLPTIGIEVEVPSQFLDRNTIMGKHLWEALIQMGIPVSQERTRQKPTEFSLPPSYSAHVQARMLYELRKMGVVPTDKSFASMHIGLGVRDEALSAKYESSDREMFFPLSDVLTYAFVSPHRIRSRQFDSSVHLKDGVRLDDVSKQTLRLELRTARVMGDKTYRMLEEIQLVGALFLPTTQQYKDLRAQFVAEYNALLEKYDLEPNLPQSSYPDDPFRQEHAAEQVEKASMHQSVFDEQLAAAEFIPAQQEREAVIGELRRRRAENLIDESRHLLYKYAQVVRGFQSIIDTGMPVENG